jgi:hypothetical protein
MHLGVFSAKLQLTLDCEPAAGCGLYPGTIDIALGRKKRGIAQLDTMLAMSPSPDVSVNVSHSVRGTHDAGLKLGSYVSWSEVGRDLHPAGATCYIADPDRHR